MQLSESGCQACPPGRCSARCRRAQIITAVTAAVPDVPVTVLANAVDAMLINPAIGRFLAEALAADPAALLVGRRRWSASWSANYGAAARTCPTRPAPGAVAPANR